MRSYTPSNQHFTLFSALQRLGANHLQMTTETAGGDEKQLLERMQQLSATLLERNGDLEGSIHALINDVETATTRMSGCHSQAQLQRDSTPAVAQVVHISHPMRGPAPFDHRPTEDADMFCAVNPRQQILSMKGFCRQSLPHQGQRRCVFPSFACGGS